MNKYIIILFYVLSFGSVHASELDSQAVLKGSEVAKMNSTARAHYLLSFAVLVETVEEAQNVELQSLPLQSTSGLRSVFPELAWSLVSEFARAESPEVANEPMPLMDGRSTQEVLQMARNGGRALAQMNKKASGNAKVEYRRVDDPCLYGAHASRFKYYEKPSASGSRVRCPRPENTFCESKEGNSSWFRCQDFGLYESTTLSPREIQKNFCISAQPSHNLTERCLAAFHRAVNKIKENANWVAGDYDLLANLVRERLLPVHIEDCSHVAQKKECAALKATLNQLHASAKSSGSSSDAGRTGPSHVTPSASQRNPRGNK